MSAIPHSGPVDADLAFDTLADGLADALTARGYALLPAALPPEIPEALFTCLRSFDDDALQQAGVGRARQYQLNPFVRGDEIRWLSADHSVEAAYLAWMDRLRLALNRRLFMGLFDYECHFARYAPGAFYKKHYDAFQGNSSRVLSTVLYLNPGWALADGGELLLYNEGDELIERVLPMMGSLLVFLSDRFPHEVLASPTRHRLSVAGWFRVNASASERVDPPR